MNVLWLMSDEHNPTVAGFAGNPIVQTPALDALAALGTVFTAAYTPNPICVQARRGMHAGMFDSNVDALPVNYEALGTYFSRMGYRAAWFGKQHWDTMVNQFTTTGLDCSKESKKRFKAASIPFPSGTRRVEDANVATYPASFHDDSICTEQALAFLDAAPTEPFFLGVSLVKPHFPFSIQDEFYQPYASAGIPDPVVTQGMLDNLSTAMQIDRDRFGFAGLTEPQRAFARKIYYGMVSYVDAQIAAVLGKLGEVGLQENTIVVYCADHGEMLGDHGIWYKNSFLEGSARVPVIVVAPGMEPGQTVAAPVNLIDLYPTLCELCGLPAPGHLEGSSLASLMTGADSGITRVAFSENKRHGIASRMIRTLEFKYCWYEDEQEQLFDMVTDPNETINLADDPLYAALKEDLKQRALDGWDPTGLFDGGE